MRRALLVLDGASADAARAAGATSLLAWAPTALEVMYVASLEAHTGGLPGTRVVGPLSGQLGASVLAPDDDELPRTERRRGIGLTSEVADAARAAGVDRVETSVRLVDGDADAALDDLAAQARWFDLVALVAAPGKGLRAASLDLVARLQVPILTGDLSACGPAVVIGFDSGAGSLAALRAAAALAPVAVTLVHVAASGGAPPTAHADLAAARGYLLAALPGVDAASVVAPGRDVAEVLRRRRGDDGVLAVGVPPRGRLGGGAGPAAALLADAPGALLLCPG